MRTILAAALFLAACGGKQTTTTTVSNTPPPPPPAGNTGWWCFHVNGNGSDGPWANSECVREQQHCSNDQQEMHGTNPDASFQDCKYVATSECYTWTNGDGQPDILCFLNDDECNQSKALDLGGGTWTNISECHTVP